PAPVTSAFRPRSSFTAAAYLAGPVLRGATLGRLDRRLTGLLDGRGLVGDGGTRLHHQRNRAHAIVLAQVHHPHTLCRPAHLRDAAGVRPLDHPVLGDEQEILVLADDQRAGQPALLRGELDGQHALGPTPLRRILRHGRPLAVPV